MAYKTTNPYTQEVTKEFKRNQRASLPKRKKRMKAGQKRVSNNGHP